MKFRHTGQLLLALLVSFGIILGLSACGSSYTLGYVFALSSKTPQTGLAVFKIDSDSGALVPTRERSYPTGQIPISAVVSPNGKILYVVNNGDNTIINFTIGTDGKLIPQHTVNTAGTFPLAAAVDAAGKNLLVLSTYAAGFSDSQPGPGQIDVFPIATDGSLPASPSSSVGAGIIQRPPRPNPQQGEQAITIAPNGNFVYVVQQGTQSIGTFSFANGTLTPVATTPAGVAPYAIAIDPTGRYVYVTDESQNLLLGYTVQSDGTLRPMVNSPFRTDLRPQGLVIDPRGKFLYTANYNANTIGSYAIDPSTGNATAISNSASNAGPGTTCITIEPATGRYVYAANFIDGTLTGAQLNPNTGALISIQNSPYPTQNSSTTCVASVANGSHAVQHIQP